MYLFGRRARLGNGHLREATEWAHSMTEKVNQITSLDVQLWTTMFSPGVGTLTWTAFVPDLTTLETATDKLLVDSGYLMLLDQGATFASTDAVDDLLSTIVHGTVDPTRQVQYAAVVEATLAAGGMQRGMEVGVEIAQRAEALTGLPTLFCLDATGAYGGIRWITGAADVAELERSEAAIAASPDFARFIDEEASKVYLAAPLATRQTIYRHLV